MPRFPEHFMCINTLFPFYFYCYPFILQKGYLPKQRLINLAKITYLLMVELGFDSANSAVLPVVDLKAY